jgi:hypothetical protein
MWKEDWAVTRRRFADWWRREDMILSNWGSRFPVQRQVRPAEGPDPPASVADMYLNPEYVVAQERYELSRCIFPADMMPFIHCDKGTVSLAPALGAEIHFSPDTVWYSPPTLSPDNDSVLALRDEDPWWRTLQNLTEACRISAARDYLCGMPSVSPGLDVLAELRGTENLCMDLVLHPEWVRRKLKEIDEAACTATKRLYDLCRDEQGWVFHAFFMFWAPGMAGLCQCDFAALISPQMFEDFALPSIRRYCALLDYSLYHVDGPQAIRTVDYLLEVEELDCIEFTPGPQIPQGGDPCWYEMYKRIREAGKCVQAVEMKAEEVVPLLDAVGPEGMYLMVNFRSEREIEETIKAVEPYRKGRPAQ